MRKLFTNLLVLAAVGIMATACVDERLSPDPAARLSFSVDRLDMDTVFSATRTFRFMVYNRNSLALNITEIRMAGGPDSPFRFNVDGRLPDADNVVHDITLRSNDSIYVLVEATSPASEADCALMLDSLLFLVNGSTQSLPLSLVGRNARLLDRYRLTADESLVAGRPYLVRNYIYVPEGARLTIEAGAELYMHAGASIVVDGELRILGTPESRVTIRGDRFDDLIEGTTHIPYVNLPGQWGGIHLQNARSSNTILWADIRGMSDGIILLGTGRSSPQLRLESSRLHCSDGYGVYAQMADLQIINSEVSNCGMGCLLVVGGSTLLRHATVADYYTFASRKYAAFRLMGYVDNYGARTAYPVDRCVVENSIVYGRNYTELELTADTSLSAAFNFYAVQSVIKGRERREPCFDNCIFGNSDYDLFVATEADYEAEEPTYFDFHLSEESPARGTGSAAVAALCPLTLDGTPRTEANPGAY